MRTNRFTRTTVVTAAVAGLSLLAGLAGPAGALPVQGGDPPDPLPRADLKVTALAATPVGSTWSVSYTVANTGTASAGASTVAFNGGPVTQAAVPSLAAGASRSGTVVLPRTDCFVLVSAMADSARVVGESSETNNARQAVGVLPPCPARYRISAVRFTAVDESGIDWTGSDEPYWIFNSVSNGGTATSRASQVFEDIDPGDTQSFGSADSCLWGCASAGAPAPFGVGLSVQLWEKDLGHVDQTLYDTAKAFQAAGPILSVTGPPAWVGAATSAMGTAMNFILGWADDDLLGSNTYAFSSGQLAASLPARGMSFSDTRTYQGGGATYTLTMQVTRIV